MPNRFSPDLSEDVRTMVETEPLLETVSTKISANPCTFRRSRFCSKTAATFQSAYSLGYENAPSVALVEMDKTIEKIREKRNARHLSGRPLIRGFTKRFSQKSAKLQQIKFATAFADRREKRTFGVISLSPKRSEEPYSPNDLRLLKSVAAQTGLALENSRLTEAIAREVGTA